MPALVTLAPTTSGSLLRTVGRIGHAVVWISLAISTNFLAIAAGSSGEDFSDCSSPESFGSKYLA
jgi:hypothetical protein